MPKYELTGPIRLINDTQTFASGFAKREFVVETGDKYPQLIKLEVVKDKTAELDKLRVNDVVNVSFDVRGNEYNGKYYVNLSCWKLSGGSGGGGRSNEHSQESPAEPSPEDLRKTDDFDDDDIPF